MIPTQRRARPMRETLGLRSDVADAWRSMRTHPRLTALAVTILALGLGANAAMFSIADRLLIQAPSHLRQPVRVGRVYFSRVVRGESLVDASASYPMYERLRDAAPPGATVAAFFTASLVVGQGASAERVPVTLVSASFWDLFRSPIARGRVFGPSEDRVAAASDVVVLGNATWRSRFGRDPAVIGRVVRIGARRYTVIGVASPGFTGMDLTEPFGFVPLASGGSEIIHEFASRWQSTWLELCVERPRAVSAEIAAARLTRVFEAEELAHHDAASVAREMPTIVVGPAIHERGPLASGASRVSGWLLGLSIVVAIIGCLNTTSLLMARAESRRREVAVRVALGGGRWRLGRMLLAESIALALIAGVVGLAASAWARGLLGRLLLAETMESGTHWFDARTTMVTAAAAMCCGVFAGVVSAMQVGQLRVWEALRSGDRGASAPRSKARAALVVSQVSLSVTLLVGAGLFVRSFYRARTLDLGYGPDGVLLVAPDFRAAGIDADDGERRVRELADRARSLPGVERVALAATVPFYRNSYDGISIPGRDSVPHRGAYAMNAVTPEYFATLRTPVLRGRGIVAADVDGSPLVMVVSASMARTLWPGLEPIGQCVRIGGNGRPCRTVVGVAADIRRGTLEDDRRLQYYVPYTQYPAYGTILLRMRAGAGASAANVQREVQRDLQRLVPPLAFVRVEPLAQRVAMQRRSWELGAVVFVLFATLAVMLVAAGLFGVLGFEVTSRRREFGIRRALGASASHVTGIVLSRAGAMLGVGLAIGLSLSTVVSGRLEGLLLRTSTHDPATFVGTSLLLVAVGSLAALVPTRRAIRAPLTEVLHAE